MNQSLGTKRQCPSCTAKFYDMQRSPVTCPKCDYLFPAAKAPKVKAVAAPKPKPKKLLPIIDGDDEVIDELEVVVELEELNDFEDDVEHLKEVEDHHEEPEMSKNTDDAEDGMFLTDIADNDTHLVDEPESDEETEEMDELDDDYNNSEPRHRL